MTQFPKNIALLGSTSSIGQQTLDVVRHFPEYFRIVALAARSNVSLLEQQAREFEPSLVACFADTPSVEAAARAAFPNIVLGEQGLLEVTTHPQADIVVAATSGLMGLEPTLAAIRAGKTIALANKETLVMAGHLVMREAQRAGVSIVPVDSEHSAIWQCLRGERTAEVKRLLLTASGGPFRRAPLEQLRAVTVEQALAHPTWQMGPKITIDSATLMNKAFEAIEARWLYHLPYSRIEAVIHPSSVVHSLVEFVDGSFKAQLGLPDMHLPIQYALTHPERLSSPARHAPPTAWGTLEFRDLDQSQYPGYRVVRDAAAEGGNRGTILNAADEVAA